MRQEDNPTPPMLRARRARRARALVAALVCVWVVGSLGAQEGQNKDDLDSNGAGGEASEAIVDRWTEQMPRVMPSTVAGAESNSDSHDVLRLLPGFQIELLYEVPKETHG